MNSLPQIMRATIAQYEMFRSEQTVVVAVSGGPDSTALLHALAGLRDECPLTLVAAHLDHGFRGAESEADASYVAALCERLDIPVRIERADVPQIRRRLHRSAQETAREVRHAFLQRVAAEVGAARIALGHTRDDRVETILINLLRGAGAEGLSGFPPVDGLLARPLYEVSRAQTVAYCAEQALSPRTDSSNASLDYLRNRVRTELLPTLISYYNSRADTAILRMSDLISADNIALEQIAATFLSGPNVVSRQDEIILGCEAVQALPLAVRRRVLRQAIARVRGHLQGVTFEMIERVLQSVARRTHGAITLPATGALTVGVQCDPAGIRIFHMEPPSCPVPWQIDLPVPGRTWLAQAGMRLEAACFDTAADLDAFLSANALSGHTACSVVVRQKDIALPLTARSWRPGDRIRRSGGRGTRKLQDLFVDARIPAAQRSRVPVVTDSNRNVLAVIGVAVSELTLRPGMWREREDADETGGWIALICLSEEL